MLNSADWKRAVVPLLETPAAWGFRGKLAYAIPITWVLRGVLAEGSQTPDEVYVWSVTMPLFIPVDHLILDHSTRVSGRHSSSDLGVAVQAALRSVSPEEVALRRIAASNTEEAAYASLILGDEPESRRLLASTFAEGDDRLFVLAARERRESIRTLLLTEGASEALAQLGRWRHQTARALNLERRNA